MPMEFIKLYRKRYDPLIVGYIKELEHNDIVPNLPIVLQKLILYYYPWF